MLLSIPLALTLAACSNGPSSGSPERSVSPSPNPVEPVEPVLTVAQQASQEEQIQAWEGEVLPITVHKTPTCGCCSGWVEHLRRHGFDVEVVDHQDLAPIKQQLGVPAHLASCHTAVVKGMFVEGHVPAMDIRKMVEVAPYSAAQIKGVAVPGMPVGSPGMEMGDRLDPYRVLMVDETGEELVFAEYGN